MTSPQRQPLWHSSDCGELCGAVQAWIRCSKILNAQETKEISLQESWGAVAIPFEPQHFQVDGTTAHWRKREVHLENRTGQPINTWRGFLYKLEPREWSAEPVKAVITRECRKAAGNRGEICCRRAECPADAGQRKLGVSVRERLHRHEPTMPQRSLDLRTML